MKLIPMTDFVLKFDKPVGYYEDQNDFLHNQVEFMEKVMNYAKFLKQPLKLGMFVPQDEEGNVLEDPVLLHGWDINGEPTIYTKTYKDELAKYNEAKERVLFKGFEVEPTENNRFQYLWLDKKFICSFPLIEVDRIRKVEDLIPYEITLSESAINQIEL